MTHRFTVRRPESLFDSEPQTSHHSRVETAVRDARLHGGHVWDNKDFTRVAVPGAGLVRRVDPRGPGAAAALAIYGPEAFRPRRTR